MTHAPPALCLAALLAALPLSQASAAPLDMEGFAWAENLTFDGRGGLIVSDAFTGDIWRIEHDGEGHRRTLIATGFEGALGLAYLRVGGPLFAAVRTLDDTAPYQIVAIAGDGTTTTIVSLPEAPNGLEADTATGLLYATTEADFAPGEAAVYEVDPLTYSFTEVMSGLFGADGAAIDVDARMLYVGEVLSGVIHIYDLDSGEIIDSFQGLHGRRLQFLDDFELSEDREAIIGADFMRGTVVRIPIGVDLRGQPEGMLEGFTAPTAVVRGEAPFWDTSSLFISEGGGFRSWATNGRVVEIPGALP